PPPGVPRNPAAEPLVDDHVLDGGRRGRGLVGGLLHLHDLAAPIEAVGRHQHLRLAVLEPRGDGLGAVAPDARGGAVAAAGDSGENPPTRSHAPTPRRLSELASWFTSRASSR